ncbi:MULTISPECIES: type IA DNA topoisomerase [unclassified Bacteroides]|jgi:DNA topoisomerase-3|uniref:type IA DNA topoisomerase n=1 Tax=unclassified Bacteroides TaxID=2646097 RepID=UPI00164B2E47|nr:MULTISPECIES: type IA DNA topoisomerase [unclassified Bacteroides]MBC5609248.1 DNA topoisomerase III [Bacteroides sp. NSJ-48]MDU4539073.1 DNA topoisomerase III [Bacteroides sp.]MDU4863306.1 DNA topoisomerase III [Bacteroides sp.]
MKTIIAEKPSVAREIARIVGATKREEGYFEGGGYAVTWAFGHLVQLAMPDGYGVREFVRDNLPVIPETFTLIPRQVKTEKGYKPDSGVTTQIKVITSLFNKSEQIIVATDAGREGELIFRYLYHYIGCATPFVRLWISSLTDKAIRDGLRNLENGSKYDNLYLAAKARSESDWLVGINGTQALSIAAGHGTYSVGRVQTPTLGMVCERYRENRRFTPEAFWQLHIAVDGNNDGTVKLSSSEKWKEKEPATALYNKVKEIGAATVTKAERKEKTEDTPLLYDLTTLQKEANAKHGFTAEQTLEIAQKLYEKKLITYPRTGSRYIPEDVFAEIPKLLAFIGALPEWKGKVQAKVQPTRRNVDGSKVTDHHALLVTGEKPLFLSKEDNTVYQMIAGRMIEAFSEKCVKDTTAVTAECAGVEFIVKGSVIRQAGWRAVYGEEDKEEISIPDWQEGDTLTLKGCSITEGKTKPKPLHTEATLLSAMETAGKEIEDDALRQALKDCGIGTPATRAAIIETLFKRGYMERCKKSLVPTEKGLALYSVVKTMRIADVALTGEWEKELARIERGELSAETFRKEIEAYTREITSELLSCDKLFSHKDSGCACPKCGTGRMQFYGKVVRCDNAECGLPVFRLKANRTLSDDEIKDLLTDGHTKLLKGFKSKQGKSFDAIVAFDGEFNTTFVFPERKTSKKFSGRKK